MAKPNKRPLRCIFISMGLLGSEGSMVNERELAKALARNIEFLYVLTFVPVNKLLRYAQDLKDLRCSLRNRLVVLPNFLPPPINGFFSILNLFITYINSLQAMMFALMFRYSGLIDVVYVRDPRVAIAFFSPAKVRLITSVKFGGFYTQDMERPNSIIGDFLVNFFERVNRIVINKTDLLVVQNKLYEPFLRRFYGLSDDHPVLELPAGISRHELPKGQSQTRRNNKETTPEHIVGYVGSVSWEAGLDILLDAMTIVQQTMPHVVLSITVGGGSPSLIDELMARAKQSKLNSNFIREVAHKRALEIMKDLDVLVVPRRRTLSAELTIPIKVIEAFALGVPVIMTRHRILEEKYTDGQDILLAEPEPEDVAGKILGLLSDPQMAETISKRGMANSKEFDYDALALHLANALSDL